MGHRVFARTSTTSADTYCSALFFCSEYGVETDELRVSYNSLRTVLCDRYRLPQDPKDFEEALRVLEGSFIDITSDTVSYVNPSLRDYLTEYLDDFGMLRGLCFLRPAKYAGRQSLWKFGNREITAPDTQRRFAASFLPISRPVRQASSLEAYASWGWDSWTRGCGRYEHRSNLTAIGLVVCDGRPAIRGLCKKAYGQASWRI